MKTSTQIGVAIAFIVGAGAVTAFYAGNGDATMTQEGGGHNHGAVAGGDELNPVRLSNHAGQRIGITYAEVEVRELMRTVRTVGRVVYDETRLATVNPKVEGWVERLHVDFTGAPVTRGAPLLDLYSPMLVSAQEELILARRLSDDTRGDPEGRAAANARTLLESARRRLEYWDIPTEVVTRIEETGVMTKTLTLRAPASGIVVEKGVVEGDRIMPGMSVYRIADLSTIWVEGDVFEKDLSLVHLGQQGTVTLEAYPGQTFSGRVTYIYPTVSVQARTGRIRLELPNPDLRIMPGMYAEIELSAPEGEPALLIPRSAVLSTGERSVVFVPAEDGTLMPREITVGLAAGREVEVLAGLVPGERVVSSAGFLIDAESNLGTSMAEVGEAEDHSGHGDPGEAEAAPSAPADIDKHQN